MNSEFENIYNLFGKNIYRLAYSYVFNKQEAEDITQKTFYKLYIHKKILKQDEKNIKQWLIQVCVNEAKDFLKSSWHKVSNELPDNISINPNNQLFEVMNQIEIIYRLPLYLYYYEGYSIKEIAKILKKSESAIKMRLSRGKEKLREEITS